MPGTAQILWRVCIIGLVFTIVIGCQPTATQQDAAPSPADFIRHLANVCLTKIKIVMQTLSLPRWFSDLRSR